jgi:N-acetylmuramoyl-L-alanine amidase
MLLFVGHKTGVEIPKIIVGLRMRSTGFRARVICILALLSLGLGGAELSFSKQSSQPQNAGAKPAVSAPSTNVQNPTQGPAQNPPAQNPAAPAGAQTAGASTQTPAPQKQGLSVVVLDPAHGGTDLGARGSGGIRESDIVMGFASELRKALTLQGFQVLQTRQRNEDPSFDDRSAVTNAQHGAVFVSLHIASTGLPGTVRVYVMNDIGTTNDAAGLISWDFAQAPFLPLSHKLGDEVAGFLSQRFKGSPNVAQVASVRQLRTTAAPAIAVEVSNISVDDRAELDRMAPGVADAIALGLAAFRAFYVTPNIGERP